MIALVGMIETLIKNRETARHLRDETRREMNEYQTITTD